MKTVDAKQLAKELHRIAGMLEGETVAAERDDESGVESVALERLRELLDTFGS